MGHTLLLEHPAEPCIFIERLNRFTGIAVIRGREERIHITNTGRLHDFLVKGRRCIAYRINGVKLKHRLMAVQHRGGYALIDTRMQMQALEKAIEKGVIPWLAGCRITARNPKTPTSVLDYRLECRGREVLVEVKSAVLEGPSGEAMYPDCPTERGRRHVKEIITLAGESVDAMIIMIAAFPGARCFKPYKEGDPGLYQELTRALTNGVPVKAVSLYTTYTGTNAQIYLENPDLPLCREWVKESESNL